MTDKPDDGGPVYAYAGSEDRTDGDMPDGNRYIPGARGMSLRARFAAQFAAAWLPIVSHDHDDPCVAGVEANTYGLAQADDLLRRLKEAK